MKISGFLCFLAILMGNCMLNPVDESPGEKPTISKKICFQAKRSEVVSLGKIDSSGLQLECWFDNSQQIIWCAIRNMGNEPIRYSNYLLGYLESAVMKIRSKNKWQALDYRPEKRFLLKSAGASKEDIHVIHPGKEMVASDKPIDHLVSTDSKPKYSFFMDPNDFIWPSELKAEIEIIISQRLGHDGSKDTWEGTLHSGIMKLNCFLEK